jgi:hypothetical protein
MFELVLGVLLATIFVTAYLLITKLLRQETRELRGTPPSVTLNPLETARNIGPQKSARALTTGEMSEHHAGGEKNSET